MAENEQNLLSKLATTQQQLQDAQARVAHLEAQLNREQASAAELPASDDCYDRILDYMLEGCQLIGFDWRYLYVNETVVGQSRQAKDELLGHTMMECYPGIEKTEMFAVLKRCMQERTRERIENEFVYPDGKHAWFELSVQPVPEGLFILSLDITERKRTEEALKRSTQRMEILHEIDSGIINATSIQTLIDAVLIHIRQLIPCQHVSVTLVDDTTPEWLSFATDRDQPSELETGTRLGSASDVSGEFGAESINMIEDLLSMENPDSASERLIRDGIRSVLHAPFAAKGQPIGSLHLLTDIPGFFTDEHREIAAEISNQLAIAIHQMRLAEDIERNNVLLEQRVKERTAELQAAKQRVEAILNYSPDGILLLDTDLNIQQTNASFDRLFGSGPDDHLGKSLIALILAQDADHVTETVQAVVAQGQRARIEIHALRKDGVVFDAELTVGHIQSDGIVGVIRDITERKAHERQLRYHASLQDNVSDAVIVTDVESRIQSWNRAAERIYGWTADEVIGKAVGDILHTKFSAPDSIERSRQQLREQGWWQGEVTQRRKDGRVLHILGSVTLVKDENGVPHSIVAVNHDFSEHQQMEEALREREERFRQIAENFDQILFVRSDDDQEILYVNQVYETMLGRSRQSLYENPSSFLEMVHPDDLDHVRQQLTSQRYVEEGRADFEYRIITSDGHIRWARAHTFPINNDDGTIARRVGTVEDITEAKERERMLRYFASIQESVSDAVIATDLDFRIQSWNQAAERIYGWRAGEVLGKSSIDVLQTQLPADEAHEQGVQILQGQGFLVREVTQHHKDGRPLHILGSAVVLRDEAERPIGFAAVNRDITQRKQAEAALRASEEKFRLLLDAAPVATIISDQTGHIALINMQTEQLFGYDRSELVGQMVEILVPDYLRDIHIRNRAKYFAEPRVRRMGDGMELFARRKDGSVFPVEIELSYIETDNGLMVMSFVGDITERKQSEAALKASEEKYRQLIETMRGGLVVLDTDLKMTYVNDRFCQLLGYSREELIGTMALAYADATSQEKSRTEFERRSYAESSSYEIILKHKTGNLVDVLVSGTPLFDKNGIFNGSFAVVTDISAQKQAEATLRQALQKEKELSELKSRFVSMASHEFRTPLATILALTETLSAYRHKMSEERIDERFDRIRDQIQHLKDIMEDVLLLARMQARRVEFNPDQMDLDALCRSVLDEFQSRSDVVHQINYTCHVVLQDVMLDKKLMRQIISNLVSNAIKYSPADKPINVNLDYNASMVILEVRDEGIGIPEVDLPHLFEPFHRAANVDTIPGTGLGLVIVKEAVDLHGGTIAVDSRVNEGTTFTIRIPISRLEGRVDDTHRGD